MPCDANHSSISEFLSAVKSLPYNTGNQPGSALPSAKPQGVVIDARKFLLETRLSGKLEWDVHLSGKSFHLCIMLCSNGTVNVFVVVFFTAGKGGYDKNINNITGSVASQYVIKISYNLCLFYNMQ